MKPVSDSQGEGPPQKRFKVLRRRVRNWLVGVLGPLTLRILMVTVRYRWSGSGLASTDSSRRKPVIYAFWHRWMLGFVYSHRGRGVRVLISSHGDGEMISRVTEYMGFHPSRGSTTRRGPRAIKEMLRDVKSGFDFAITPDGPRGPRHAFQAGVVYFASRSRLPIVYATIAYRHAWILPTWDGFVIPWPFTRAACQFHGPIEIPYAIDPKEIENWRQKLEAGLLATSEDTEARFETIYREGLTTRQMTRLVGLPGKMDSGQGEG